MIILRIKNISFGNYIKTSVENGYIVENEYSDNDNLLKQIFKSNDEHKQIRKNIEYDDSGRVLVAENFDKDGLWLNLQKFKYSEGKKIEIYNSKEMNYVRTTEEFIKDSIKHIKEVYESSSAPSNNYIYETTRDLKGKMLSFFCNGKKVL